MYAYRILYFKITYTHTAIPPKNGVALGIYHFLRSTHDGDGDKTLFVASTVSPFVSGPVCLVVL